MFYCFLYSIRVDLWANKLGDQLWNLGLSVTRSQDIKKVSKSSKDKWYKSSVLEKNNLALA